MGAVRNLFVRIGGDASGAVKGFKDASKAGTNAEKNIKKSSTQTRKTIRETFTASVPSIKEYAAQVASTKTAHQTATQNVSRLEDEVAALTEKYDEVKNIASGLDMSASIQKQVADTENLIESLGKKIDETKEKINFVNETEPEGMQYSMKPLQDEMQRLIEKSDAAVQKLIELERVEQMMGEAASAKTLSAGLEEMESELVSVQNELNTAQKIAEETGETLNSMGVKPYLGKAIKGIGKTAAHAAGTGVRTLWSGVKKLGAGAVSKGISSLTSKLKNIGKSASGSTGGMTRLVRSIRNIGIASLGLKVAGGMFGRMRSIVSSYISQNETLNNSISTLKNQMGEALAPAINVVVAALQHIMPVVTAVSNGISSIFKALFGDIATTSQKIESAKEGLNTYGFDQITKESDNDSETASSGTTQGGEQSTLVTKLTDWLMKLKTAFMAGDWKTLGGTFAEGINSAFSALGNSKIGSKLGGIVNAIVTTLHSLLTGIDFRSIGEMFGSQMTDAFKAIDWNTVGETIGQLFVMLPSIITGWISGTDWGVVADSLSAMIISCFGEITTWIKETDWLQLGESIMTFITSIDWGGILYALCEGMGAVLTGLGKFIWGLLRNIIADVVEGVVNFIIKGINGLLNGLNAFLDLGKHVGLNLAIPTIPKLKLPRAAQGTIVTKATNLTVGEDGAEAVVPLQKHTEWIDILATKLAAKTASTSNNSGGGSATFQFYLGNRKITEYIVKDINQLTRENGVCPIHV